jgi:hypothetical protein
MAFLDDVLEEMKNDNGEQSPEGERQEETGAEPKKPMHTYSPEFEQFVKENKKK